MKKHFPTALLIVFLVLGVALLAYPTVSDWWNSFHQSQAVAGYVERVEDNSEEENQAMWDAAVAYNERLGVDGEHFELTEEEQAEYDALLDITGTGIMGYIEVPEINVRLPIYHGIDDTILQIAIGHIAGSSLPVGGEGTHTVLSGHRGLPSARLFTDMDRLAVGDRFSLHVLGRTLVYEIDQILTVLPDEMDALRIEEGEDYCTLVTCTPYGVNTHRLLVRGHRVYGDALTVKADAARMDALPAILVLAGIAVLCLVSLLSAYIRGGEGASEHERRCSGEMRVVSMPNRRWKALLPLVAIILFFAIVFPGVSARADGAVDLSKTGSITLEDCPLDGQVVAAYRVADMDASGGLSAVDALSDLVVQTGIDLSALDGSTEASELQAIAQTLRGRVAASPSSFEGATATVQSGVAVLAGLKPGLYLVVEDDVTVDGTTYLFSPYLLAIPSWEADGTFAYDRTVKATKFSTVPADAFSNRVLKVWKGDTQAVRPASITIDIYNGNELYESVVLSAANGWSYTWDGQGNWSVRERMDGLGNYTGRVTMSISGAGSQIDTAITVTNTYRTPGKPPSTGDATDIALAPILLAGAGICAAIGLVLWRRSRSR